jgi:hypothetical protein
MSDHEYVQNHNDDQREHTIAKIEELIELITWCRDSLRKVEPSLTDRDPRVLMFTLARCVDVYRAEVRGSSGILLAVSRHFEVRA